MGLCHTHINIMFLKSKSSHNLAMYESGITFVTRIFIYLYYYILLLFIFIVISHIEKKEKVTKKYMCMDSS